MSRSTLPIFALLFTTASAFADGTPIPLDNLPDPDPLLLEHAVQLQRNIYASSLELQYARNLGQLCKANPTADRCEGYEPGETQGAQYLPGTPQALPLTTPFAPGSQSAVMQSSIEQTSQTAQKLPFVEEVTGSGSDVAAILSLPSGERRTVQPGDHIEGIGTVSRVDRSGVTLTTRSGQTRLAGGR